MQLNRKCKTVNHQDLEAVKEVPHYKAVIEDYLLQATISSVNIISTAAKDLQRQS